MTSGYIPPEGEPDPDDILAALRKALEEDPNLAQTTEEEVARRLVSDGYLEREPSPVLVAEALQTIEAGEGNPT